MWVYIPWWFATQWPSPDGFHVPLSSEWSALCGILISTFWLANNATTMGTYLKMPLSWMRGTNSSVSLVGSEGYYWASNVNGSNYANRIYFYSWRIYPQNSGSVAYWHSIRCFKNSPTIPTSSWTTLYQGSWSAWIFWNSTDGLISVSGDGTTWYTIQDKNLWATTVFNQWNTVNDANSWYFFQWWNNYWFPHSWTVTTSSTKVDVTWYWPWNYYSSSTWITTNPRNSTDNWNLRWWVDGNVLLKSELKNAYIGEYIPNFATQWPCPDGFHVPLTTEWQAVYNIWTTLGGWSSDWTNFWIALKLPFAGRRERLSSIVSGQGSNGFYWSPTPYSSNNAYSLYFNSSNIYHQDSNNRSHGFSVRCFKNTPVIPTSSWTKLYWTSIEAGGIFWSSTDWLISLSSDWNTWITIADKNLGATTVWNSGDTLSESNCGKYYQRWNNYGFPRTWSVTTSSTQVDASTYWPWNYYSSSTFITRSSSPYDWSSVQNDNLRWWEDGNIPVD